MSIESAKAFIEKMRVDEDFRNSVGKSVLEKNVWNTLKKQDLILRKTRLQISKMNQVKTIWINLAEARSRIGVSYHERWQMV